MSKTAFSDAVLDTIWHQSSVLDGYKRSYGNLSFLIDGYKSSYSNLSFLIDGHKSSYSNLYFLIDGYKSSYSNVFVFFEENNENWMTITIQICNNDKKLYYTTFEQRCVFQCIILINSLCEVE